MDADTPTLTPHLALLSVTSIPPHSPTPSNLPRSPLHMSVWRHSSLWPWCCRKLASEDKASVFMTDVLLTSLMCAPRSVYSWDIVVTRAGDKLFFDKRDGSNLDYLTVAETAPESVLEEKDNINGVQQLSQEATAVNQAFSQQAMTCSCSARCCPCIALPCCNPALPRTALPLGWDCGQLNCCVGAATWGLLLVTGPLCYDA